MTPNVQRHNCSIYLGSWRRSEKQATFTLTENLWLHGRVVGWFFRGWAVRFMFRARPFVIMAECKQTDIIWRLLHQDLPLLHCCCYTAVTHCYTDKTGRRKKGFDIKGVIGEEELAWIIWIALVLSHIAAKSMSTVVLLLVVDAKVKSTKPLHTGFFRLGILGKV